MRHPATIDPFDNATQGTYNVTINQQPFKSALAGASLKCVVMDAIFSVSDPMGMTRIEHYPDSVYWHVFTSVGYYLLEVSRA